MPAYGESLSERELDVLEQVAAGASNREIADALVISPNTVKVHLRNIYTKLGVSSRTEAATVALQQGLLQLDSLEADSTETAAVAPAPAREPEPAVDDSGAAAAAPMAVPQPAGSDVPATDDSRATTIRPRRALLTLLLFAVVVIPVLILLRDQFTRPVTPEPALSSPVPTDQPIADSNWFLSQALPQARAGAAIAAIGLDLYLIAGRTETGVVDAVDIFETNNRGWHAGAVKPTAVTDSSAAVLFGQIYVPGGRLADGQPTNVVEAYSPVNDAWQLAAALPTPVYGALTAAAGQFLYVIGGFTEAGVTDANYAFDPGSNSWRPLPPLPTARGFTAGAVVNGEIYVVGGNDGDQAVPTCERFDPQTETWAECPPLLQARQGAGATVIPNRLYVFGGQAEPTAAMIFGEFYDPASDNWQLVNLPDEVARPDWAYFGMASIEQRIFVLGGSVSDELSNEMLVFHPFPFQSFIPAASSNR